MRRYDFLVVGSGIAGASIACEIAPFASVLVVEREASHGYHTSGRSAAMFIESYGGPWVRRLTRASRGFFDAPPDGFCRHPLLTPRPCLTLARQTQTSSLDARAADIAATGSEMREIDGAAARSMAPILRPDAVARAILEPNACDIDTHGLHSGYLRMGRARGADVRLDAGVASLERSGDSWRITLSDGIVVEAGAIINAAGAWADQVAEQAGAAPVGLEPRRRTAIIVDPPDRAAVKAWPTVIDVDETFYFKPESGRLLASPADETPSPPVDAAPEEIDIAICIDRIQTATILSVSHVHRAWAGLRTFARDRTPVFGYDPDIVGFFWFAGQGGFGMQTAPAAARLGAALALGHETPSDLSDAGLTEAAFSPSRLR